MSSFFRRPITSGEKEFYCDSCPNGYHCAVLRECLEFAQTLVTEVDDAELQLGRWRFHPSIAAEAVRWAWDRHQGGEPRGPAAA